MMTPNLNEFSSDQLQHALDEIVAGMVRLEKFPAVKEYIKFQFGATNSADARIIQRYNNLSLWRVQILNAISTVQRREQITNS